MHARQLERPVTPDVACVGAVNRQGGMPELSRWDMPRLCGPGTSDALMQPDRDVLLTGRRKTVSELAHKSRILFMDDEEMIRDTMKIALKVLGYEPTVCGDGMEALELYRQAMAAGASFAGVIVDLTVPGGMGGKEAVARLLEIDPAARVIVSSGYSSDPVMAHYDQFGFCGAISKPYNCKELGTALQEIIGNNLVQGRAFPY